MFEAGRSTTPAVLAALYDQSRLIKDRAGLTDTDEEQAIFEQAQERANDWLQADADELGRSLVGRLLPRLGSISPEFLGAGAHSGAVRDHVPSV